MISMSNDLILDVLLWVRFEPWKGKVRELCMFYENYVYALRTLWEWSVYYYDLLVLLKGYSHIHTYDSFLFICILNVDVKVFSQNEDFKVERVSH